MYAFCTQLCWIVKTSLISLASNKFREPRSAVSNSFECASVGWCRDVSVRCGYLSWGISPCWHEGQRRLSYKLSLYFLLFCFALSDFARPYSLPGFQSLLKAFLTCFTSSLLIWSAWICALGWVCSINTCKTTNPGRKISSFPSFLHWLHMCNLTCTSSLHIRFLTYTSLSFWLFWTSI